MKINVTQEHIDKGDRQEPQSCALSLAITEATSKAVAVGVWHVVFRDSGERYELPPEAKEFRLRFDENKPVHPFTFELDI